MRQRARQNYRKKQHPQKDRGCLVAVYLKKSPQYIEYSEEHEREKKDRKNVIQYYGIEISKIICGMHKKRSRPHVRCSRNLIEQYIFLQDILPIVKLIHVWFCPNETQVASVCPQIETIGGDGDKSGNIKQIEKSHT